MPILDDDGQDKVIRKEKSRAEHISDKIHALCWMGAAASIAHVSDFVNVMSLHNDEVCRPIFYLGATLLVVNAALTIYLVLFLSRVLKIDHTGWSLYCPRIIPAMTGMGICSFFLFTRATWPV